MTSCQFPLFPYDGSRSDRSHTSGMRPQPKYNPLHTRPRGLTRVAIMVGWPELGDVEEPALSGPGGKYRRCEFKYSLTCPAGWEATAYIDMCSMRGVPDPIPAEIDDPAKIMSTTAYSVEGSNFTLLRGQFSRSNDEGYCWANGENKCKDWINTLTFGNLSVNGQLVLETLCIDKRNSCNYTRSNCQSYYTDKSPQWRTWCCEPF